MDAYYALFCREDTSFEGRQNYASESLTDSDEIKMVRLNQDLNNGTLYPNDLHLTWQGCG